MSYDNIPFSSDDELTERRKRVLERQSHYISKFGPDQTKYPPGARREREKIEEEYFHVNHEMQKRREAKEQHDREKRERAKAYYKQQHKEGM